MATVNLRQSTLAAIINNKNDRLSGKKSKLQDTKNNMVKPSKRAALGTITNIAATRVRVQPSRAAKQVRWSARLIYSVVIFANKPYKKDIQTVYFANQAILFPENHFETRRLA